MRPGPRRLIRHSRLSRVTCALFIVSGVGCAPQGPPVITTLQPSAGPSGSIVTVSGDNFGTGGTLLFDMSPVRSVGTGSPMVFTVPYTATIAQHNIQVEVGSQISANSLFQVTSSRLPPVPVVQGFEVGYYSVAAVGDSALMELVLFGTGFDSNCEIVFDGSDIGASYTPGVPIGSLLGVFAGGTTMIGFPPADYDKACAALLSVASNNLPKLGSTHGAAIKNVVTNAVSNTISVQIPSRRVLVELDKLAGVAWPSVEVFQNGAVNTTRRTYTAAGLLIDTRYDQDAVADPRAPAAAGTAFSDADVLNFSDATQTLNNAQYKLVAAEWYFHVSLLTSSTNANLLGRMFDVPNRQAMVVFATSAPSVANYLRTWMHEMGHGFNLTHCEGDAVPARDPSGNVIPFTYTTLGTTIMSQTAGLAANWTFNFSSAAQTHLTGHPLNEVQPGTGKLAFNSSSRIEGSCDF
jgi:IPT/TIG domain